MRGAGINHLWTALQRGNLLLDMWIAPVKLPAAYFTPGETKCGFER